MKNSRTMVLIAAILVAAGLGIYYLNSGTHVNGKDAEGAIGAVQKHRAEQIKTSDVVLGDEQFKRETQALFDGYFAQAADLEAMSVSIAMFTNNVDSKIQTVEAFEEALASLEQNLESRWAAEQVGAVAIVDELMKMEQLAAFRTDLELMQRDLQALARKDMSSLESFDAQLARITQSLASRSSETLALERMVTDVQAMRANVESRTAALSSEELQKFELNLVEMREALQNEQNLEMRLVIENRLEQLGAKGKALNLMARVDQQVEALSRIEGFSREALAARNPDMLAISQQFVALAAQLEGRAAANVEARFEVLAAEAESLAGAREQLGRFAENVGTRAGSLKARGFEQAVANLDQALSSRTEQLGGRVSDFALAELAAINAHVENHMNLESRYEQALGMKASELQARTAALLAQRGYVADLQAMEVHLGKVSQDIAASRVVGPEAKANLSSKVSEVQSRVSTL